MFVYVYLCNYVCTCGCIWTPFEISTPGVEQVKVEKVSLQERADLVRGG